MSALAWLDRRMADILSRQGALSRALAHESGVDLQKHHKLARDASADELRDTVEQIVMAAFGVLQVHEDGDDPRGEEESEKLDALRDALRHAERS